METDKAAGSGRTTRTNPILLVLLGLVAAAFIAMRLGGSADPAAPASNVRGAPPAAAQGELDPAALDVKLEALTRELPGFGETERNPFRFQSRPPERSAPPDRGGPPPDAGLEPGSPEPPAGAPSPGAPPITVRFIGLIERADGVRVAVFVDCTVGRRTSHAREGEIIDGRYRLVKIGLESVVVEHLDGRGRTTLAQSGQECVGR